MGGPDGDFDKAMQRVYDELTQANADDMSAYFVCALALVWPDGDEVCVEGRVTARLHGHRAANLDLAMMRFFNQSAIAKALARWTLMPNMP